MWSEACTKLSFHHHLLDCVVASKSEWESELSWPSLLFFSWPLLCSLSSPFLFFLLILPSLKLVDLSLLASHHWADHSITARTSFANLPIFLAQTFFFLLSFFYFSAISARHWPTTYSSEAMSENLSLFSLPLASHFFGAVFSCGCNLTPTVLVLELVVVMEMRNSSREQRTVSTFADIRKSSFSVFHYSQSYSVDHLDSVCL